MTAFLTAIASTVAQKSIETVQNVLPGQTYQKYECEALILLVELGLLIRMAEETLIGFADHFIKYYPPNTTQALERGADGASHEDLTHLPDYLRTSMRRIFLHKEKNKAHIDTIVKHAILGLRKLYHSYEIHYKKYPEKLDFVKTYIDKSIKVLGQDPTGQDITEFDRIVMSKYANADFELVAKTFEELNNPDNSLELNALYEESLKTWVKIKTHIFRRTKKESHEKKQQPV